MVLPWTSGKSFSWIYFHFSWVTAGFLRVELLGHMLILHLCYVLRSYLFCRVAVPFSVASSSVWRFQFLCVLINICYYILIMAIQWVWNVFHCDYDLRFPDYQWRCASFRVLVGHLYILFGEMSIQIFCLILISSLTSYYCIIRLLCILDTNPLSGNMICRFSPLLRVVFLLSDPMICNRNFLFCPVYLFCCCLHFWFPYSETIA